MGMPVPLRSGEMEKKTVTSSHRHYLLDGAERQSMTKNTCWCEVREVALAVRRETVPQ
jgi:hypothetical protein